MARTVLSIQSAVAYGMVGNAVAQPALQRLGCDVWRIDTVVFSNHPGHGAFAGRVVPASEIAQLVQGLDDLGVLGRVDAVISGYLGGADAAEAVADAVARIRRANPGAIYVLDPVIGDGGRSFVKPGVAEAIADRLLSLADLVTPNPFELGWLTASTVADEAGAHAAARALRPRLRRDGLAAVVVTGVPQGHDRLITLALTADGTLRARQPRIARGVNGTGDLFTALLTGWLLRDGSTGMALARTIAGLVSVMQATLAADADELRLIDALDRVAAPSPLWPIERLPSQPPSN
jgi:pyridoxine kinase